MSASNRYRPAFTLIELLVVISIISMMISILLPALGSARGTARATQCGSNIRQVMMGILQYANDHDERPPFCNWDRFADDATSSYGAYGGILFARNYLSNIPTYFCPEQRYHNSVDSHLPSWQAKSSRWQYTGYGANRFGFMPRHDDIYDNTYMDLVPRVSDVGGMASDLIVLAESVNRTYVGSDADLDGWLEFFASSSRVEILNPRHNDNTTFNAAYLDGHVSLMSSQEARFDPQTRAWTGSTSFYAKGPWRLRQFTQR